MILLTLFATTLILAILFSERAERTVMSTSVLFLLVGAVAGEESVGLLHLDPADPIISTLAELTLFVVLFTDGMKLCLSDMLRSRDLPGRALLLGLPLTVIGTALLARYLTDLSWTESILLGSILSPTDPVLVSAIVGRKEVPAHLRNMLSIESGMNDGLALPLIIILLHVLSGREAPLLVLTGELAAGVAIGVVIPYLIIKAEGSRHFAASHHYTPLMPFAAGILVFSLCSLLHANEYLAAFAAGVTIASTKSELPEEFESAGEPITEILKLSALMVFGALFSVKFLSEVAFPGYVFAFLALVAVRPLALWLALYGTRMPWDEFFVISWFGPKGFASVTYALLVLKSGIDRAEHIFHIAAIVTAASIIAHSSTDVPIARWIGHRQERNPSLQ